MLEEEMFPSLNSNPLMDGVNEIRIETLLRVSSLNYSEPYQTTRVYCSEQKELHVSVLVLVRKSILVYVVNHATCH